MTPKETLAKWIGDNASNIASGYLTERRGLGAERILAALTEAGFSVVKHGTKCPFNDPKYEIDPSTPCPVCGDLGTFDINSVPSRCIG